MRLTGGTTSSGRPAILGVRARFAAWRRQCPSSACPHLGGAVVTQSCAFGPFTQPSDNSVAGDEVDCYLDFMVIEGGDYRWSLKCIQRTVHRIIDSSPSQPLLGNGLAPEMNPRGFCLTVQSSSSQVLWMLLPQSLALQIGVFGGRMIAGICDPSRFEVQRYVPMQTYHVHTAI